MYMAYPTPSIPTVTRYSGPIGNRRYEEQLINQKPTTEVGRALEELGVTLILAHSPQAKGRIERLWNTFQDRLVSELRLAKAKTLEQAQAVLERYIGCITVSSPSRLGLGLPGEKLSALQIQRALCFKQHRTVAQDNTITFEGTVFQISKTSPFRSYANRRVQVHVLLDGAVEIFYKTEKIAAFDSKTTHTIGLYRSHAKKEGFRYGSVSMLTT